MGEYISDTPSAESEIPLMKLLEWLSRLGAPAKSTISETTDIRQESPTMHNLRFEYSPIRRRWWVFDEDDQQMFGTGNSQLEALADLVWNYRHDFNIGDCRFVILL